MAGNNTAVVKVLADNADLTKKLNQAERKLKGFERAAQRAGKNTKGTFGNLTAGAQRAGGPLGSVSGKLGGLGSMLEGLKSPAGIAAAGIAGVALAAKALEDSLNVTRDLAAKTNVLKRETGLSAEAASAYVQIAERFKISAAKLSTQFTFMSKKIGVATGDTKGAATALSQFAAAGVSEAAVKSGDLNRILGEAADRFAAMKDGTAKTRLAVQLFGKSGKDLIPFLNLGSGGIAEMQDKLKALNLTITDDTIKQNKALGKSLADLNWIFKGLQNQIGVRLIPVVSRFAQAFSEAIVKFRTGKKPTNDLERAIHNLGAMFSWLGRNWNAVKSALASSFKTMFPFVTGIVRTASSALRTDWGRMGRSLKNTTRSVKDSIVGGFRSVVNFVKNIPNRLGGLAGRFASAGRSLGKAFINNIGSGLSSTGRFLSDLGNSVRNWINANTVFGDRIKLGPIDVRVPALAAGGIVNRPTLALIGEAGPEAVVPLSGRNARKAGVTAVASGTGGNNYFTINTTGPVDEQALARSIGWQLATRGLA